MNYEELKQEFVNMIENMEENWFGLEASKKLFETFMREYQVCPKTMDSIAEDLIGVRLKNGRYFIRLPYKYEIDPGCEWHNRLNIYRETGENLFTCPSKEAE